MSGGGDLDKWIESICKCELLPELDLKHLCEYVQDLMLEESTVHPVASPVTICGDIHGQFHDLLELFRQGGECPTTSYIFMARRCRPLRPPTLWVPHPIPSRSCARSHTRRHSTARRATSWTAATTRSRR